MHRLQSLYNNAEVKCHFWATVTSNGSPYAAGPFSCLCLSVYLSVTLVYCGQIAGWIKMSLGAEVGLSPRNTFLPSCPRPPPSKRRHCSQFSDHVCCGQTAGWIKMPPGTDIDLGPGNIVLDGDPALPQGKGYSSPHFLARFALAWSPISAAAEHLFSLRQQS